MTENKESKTISEKDHDEIRLLYQNVTANLEIFKNRQWHVFVFYSAIVAFLVTQADNMSIFAKFFISVVLLIGTIAAVLTLNHYQHKMSVERKVLDNIYKHFGPIFHECKRPKEDVSKPDRFEIYLIGVGGYAYVIATFIFVMISFWYKHIC